MGRVEKLSTLLRVAPFRPGEVAGRLATVLESTWDRLRSASPECETLALDEALSAVVDKLPVAADGPSASGQARDGSKVPGGTCQDSELDLVDEEVSLALRRLPSSEPMAFSHCALRALARCAYVLCRTLRPSAVVETGVAYGMTTSYILHALERNGDGSLFSIDLPPLGDEAGDHVGQLVPERLQNRWTLLRGRSRRVLPGLLEELGGLEMFVHDSLHTYRTMTWEFRAVWPYLAKGGVLISDDIDRNRAFHDFARTVQPTFDCAVEESGNDGRFGVMVK